MDLAKQIKSKGQFINGQWQPSKETAMSSLNPADGQILWQGFSAEKAQIESAAHAAKEALSHWIALGFEKRCQIALNYAQSVERHREELAALIALESGKPFWEAKTEVNAVIGKVKLSIQSYQERTAEQHQEQNNIQSSLRYKPHGVVAVLGAFNFPAHLSNGHIVPALLAGNTVLYKPSELAPAVAELIMQCWEESGIPKGVINCLQGGVDCGKTLLAQDIQGVYFTGSYPTGLAIHKTFADRPEVILALEMGGNNPLVLGETDNVPAAVYNSLMSGFITAGQRCTCARRLIIPDNERGDHFLNAFLTASQKLIVGDCRQVPDPFMGPVIRYEHAMAHLDGQEKLIQQGGEPLLKMKLLKENSGLLSPGVIDMTSVSQPEDKEIFAPLVQIYRYRDFEQAISIANQTKYGLAAGLLSDDRKQYDHFFSKVNAGLINWNRPTTGAASNLPFGGVGHSGNHRPSAYFAADYCAYPIASQEEPSLSLPENFLPGVEL